MPSIPDEFVPIRATSPQDAPAQDDPGFLDTLKAAGVEANWPYRAYRYLENRADVQAEPDYNPFPAIKGTKFENDPERFAFARNEAETRAIMSEWDEDENARAVLGKSGWSGTVAMVGMGMLDPTIMLPIAKVFSGVAEGANALRLGADVALTGAASSAVGEGVMMATKPDYTIGDAALGVGTATVLSGLLGAGAGALLSRGERKVLEDSLHADREAWGADIANPPSVVARSPGAQSVGAAAADTRTLEMDTPGFLKKLPDVTAKVSPPRRVLNSDFETARRAVVDLVETPYIFKENNQGIATTQGPALDRLVKLETGKTRVGVAQNFDRLYTDYRFGEEGAGKIQKALTGARDMLGRSEDGKLTFADWKTEVDRALRNGDTHDIPQVAEAAQYIRQNVLDPWRDRAIAAKLLPEDIDVKTADSYMMRMWNKEKLIARRPEAKKIFADWIAEREAKSLSDGDDIVPRTRQELESLADDIVDRIVGNPDGRLPYDAARGAPANGVGGTARGPLAGRVFMIPDNMVADFIETDVQHTVEAYLRTMVPDVLLTEKFGDVDMTETFKKIKDEAAAKQSAAITEGARTKIKKDYDAVVTDLAAMRDRVRHTYGYSADPRMRMMGRVAATAARYDMITNLGGAALSSLSDLAGLQWRHGFATTFKDAWRPMLKSLADPELRAQLGKYRQQMQTLGVAAETYLATRTSGMHDILDVYKPTSRFERATSVMADKFGLASMLTPWTDFGKFAAGMVSGAELSKAADAIAAGGGTARQIRNLAEAGIDNVMADRIAKQLALDGGSDMVDNLRLPNTANWTDIGARDAFEGALARDVDLMILTPGAEKPLVMSNPVASLVLQYKTFVVAANERLLVRSLQARDAQVLQGAASAIVLGIIAEYAYSIAANRDAPNSPSDWIKAGINRSGILGWYSEGNSILAKWTGGAADAYRLIGANMPDARYISRSPGGALLGPVFGKAEATVKSMSTLLNKALGGDAEWKASDTTNMRRLVAGQNLFLIRRLLVDNVEDEVDEWLGIEPPQRGTR
ncbi:hypothetical protein RvVAR0630_18240 [Agrobacterium vitis]|uniref:hypothetical protein n=1 Tax=Agrobacterium vitis TaxID=373 RepID=UPI0015D7DED5|nr:hypothetical protein [Agrobacterium vitis]BCH59200.1 hypothetical protein RvVAR0630_18240 [Agrobacterium vitis]